MSTSTTATNSSNRANFGSAFWERLWRTAGIQFASLFIIASIFYGSQPQVGASADVLVAFYDGDRTRILTAAVFEGLAVLNLMWFAAAIRTSLADAGQDGWGAAATAASAAVGGLFLLLVTIAAALAYSIAGSGNSALTSGLNDFAWAGFVLTSFPRHADNGRNVRVLARWPDLEHAVRGRSRSRRAGLTGWHHLGERRFLDTGRRLFSLHLPAIGLVWVIAASTVLLTRSPATRAGW
jgi:hypothetical protein